MAKTKVAVLGGGVGAMVAAMRLTATAELRARYAVTVHQLGWRLGGKGASGRNPDAADRIEEHGLHLWFGFYDNAFRELRAAYEELGRYPSTDELATFEDAFRGMDTIALYDREHGRWRGMAMTCPPNEGTPGDGHGLPGFWDMVAMTAGMLEQAWTGLAADHPALGLPVPKSGGLIPAWLDPWGKYAGTQVDNALGLLKALAKAQAAGLPFPIPGLAADAAAVAALDGIRNVAALAVKPFQAGDAQVRMIFCCLDVFAAAVHGIVADRVREDGFDAINDEDLTVWLRRHGLTPLSVGATVAERAPVLRALYDVAFGYRDGDVTDPLKADIAAGTALNDLLRLVFTFRGHMAYKMQAGMGDVVFTPFYEVLKARGVRFEFFHAVQALHVDPKQDRIASIDVVRQVGLAPGVSAYDPLVTVQGLACWPSLPRADQLEPAAAGCDFENELNPLGRPATTLKRGKDFDEVVLGIAIGGLPGLVDELVARSPRFATAMQEAVTVRTQAFQLWLKDDTAQLGYPFGPSSVAGCFVEPLDTYCDMTHLIERESWPSGTLGSIAYFCGVLDHRAETRSQATDRVRQNMEAFLEDDIAGLWPAAVTAGTKKHLQWKKLAATGPAAQSSGKHARLDAQYWRANTAGSELYVLSPAGSIEHRLPSGDTGFTNLVAAGDWTRNGIDGGCVEAAAVSGIDAANAIVTRHLKPGEPAPTPPTNASVGWLGAP